MSTASIIYLQEKGLNFSGFTSAFMEFVAGKSGATVTDSAKFDEPKPETLTLVMIHGQASSSALILLLGQFWILITSI